MIKVLKVLNENKTNIPNTFKINHLHNINTSHIFLDILIHYDIMNNIITNNKGDTR